MRKTVSVVKNVCRDGNVMKEDWLLPLGSVGLQGGCSEGWLSAVREDLV